MKRLALALLLLLTASFATQAEFAGPRRTLLSGACPASVLVGSICPQAGFNFQTGTYCIQGSGCVSLSSVISVSRASSHLCQTTTGVWISVPANTACITDQGFLIEEGRTNKSTNFNATPTDFTNVTLSGGSSVGTIVSDTAALTAGGYQNIVSSGNVYDVDNTAGVAPTEIRISGTVGNTNPHTTSVVARLISGSGAASLGLNAQASAITITAAYQRFVVANITPTLTSRFFDLTIPAGARIRFTLNQLEEGAFVTSPIIIAGASAGRAADVPQLIGPALTAALAAKSAFFQTYGVEGTTGNNRLLSDSSANYMTFNNSTQVRIINATGNADANAGVGSYTTTAKTAFGFDASSVTSLFNNGTKATSATAWAPTAPFYLGNLSSGVRSLNGYMQKFFTNSVKGIYDTSTQLPYLLKRDLNPANDNAPMFLNKAA